MEIWPQMPVGVLNRSLGRAHHEYPASQIAAETQCSSRYFSEKVSVAISVELWYMLNALDEKELKIVEATIQAMKAAKETEDA